MPRATATKTITLAGPTDNPEARAVARASKIKQSCWRTVDGEKQIG
jgi:hypothetical protein